MSSLCIVDNCVTMELIHYCDTLSLYILYFKYGFSYWPLDQRGECWNIRWSETPIRKENGKGEEVQKNPLSTLIGGPTSP